MMNKLIPISAAASAAASAALAIALACGGGVAAQNAPPALPPGPGHDQVAMTCGKCHPVTQVTDKRMSEDDWSQTLDRMIGLGAKLSDEDRPVVLKYLTTNFGTDDDGADKGGSGG